MLTPLHSFIEQGMSHDGIKCLWEHYLEWCVDILSVISVNRDRLLSRVQTNRSIPIFFIDILFLQLFASHLFLVYSYIRNKCLSSYLVSNEVHDIRLTKHFFLSFVSEYQSPVSRPTSLLPNARSWTIPASTPSSNAPTHAQTWVRSD